MSYRKDQGRYARMSAFWALVLLVTYGCFHGGGLVDLLNRWLAESNPTYIEVFPLLGTLRLSTCIALGVLVAVAFGIHLVLNRPRIANALIETEAEMFKVTWPSWGETWQGTVAVASMVVVLFGFLTVVDLALIKLVEMLIGGGAA